MYKILIALFAVSMLGVNSHATGEADFRKGYSTWSVVGVLCATSVATDITASLPGFNIAEYRLGNLDITNEVFISNSSGVSANTSLATVGERLASRASQSWALGKNPDLTQSLVKIYCIAANAAGAAGVRISRTVFGYK